MKNVYGNSAYPGPPGHMNEIVGEGEGAAGCFDFIIDMAIRGGIILVATGAAIIGGVILAGAYT